METPVNPNQLCLFPVDEHEEMLFARCERYKKLQPDSQQLVRAYLRAVKNSNGKMRNIDWIRESGVAKSTAYKRLSEDAVGIESAIREAMQLVGESAASFGGVALIAAGVKIYQDITSGARSTSTLTSVELGIMRDCALISGIMSPKLGTSGSASVTVRSADGSSTTLAVAMTEAVDDLDSALDKLTGRAMRTERAA